MNAFLRSGMIMFLFCFGTLAAQVPTDWQDDTDINTFQESTMIYEGAYSCGIEVTTGIQADCDLSNLVEIPVTAGETFKVSFWYFTSEHVRMRAAFDWVGSGATYSPNYAGPTTTGDWEEFVFESEVPEGVTGVYLRIRAYDVSGFAAPETQYIDAVTFESPVGNPLPVANGGFETWPGTSPEPTSYPTAFAASANNLNIDLSWIDATGAQLPDAYLILALDNPDIIPPTDGTFVVDDLDLNDGEGAANVAFGQENFSFANLPANTTYYFKIFPYTNSGPNVDYKTDGTPPSAQATTSNVITIHFEGFDESWGGYETVSVIGDQVWDRDNSFGIGGTPCAKMSGFLGGAQENEDWLISPSFDFTQYDNEILSFYTAVGYPTTEQQLSVLVSTDYDGGGDPNAATWTELNPVLASGDPFWEWTFSEYLDVSGFESDNVHIAFKYVSDNLEAATWEVDEIQITAGGSATPIISVITPAAGAAWIQGNSYNITWNALNTLDNVTIEVTDNASAGTPTWTTLGTAVANAGSWAWDIPAGQEPGNDYQIRITDVAADVTGYSGIFSVIEPPTIYDIVINEIMYNPPPELGNDDYWEYLEIYNNENETVDLSNWYFSNGIEFTFEPGTVIGAGEYLVIARVPDSIASFYGITNLVGPFAGGALNNGGETVELADAAGNQIDIVIYSDNAPWPTEPDGNGPSLSLLDPELDNNVAENWAASFQNFGTPGELNFPAEPVLTVVYPNGGEYFQQGETYDITWSYLNFDGDIKIELINGGSTVLADAVDVSLGEWTWLVPAGQPTGDQYKIKISDAEDGDPMDESDDVFSIIEPVEVPFLVITEIMYNPPEAGNDSLEFLEIYNNDINAVDLTDYYFSEGIEFTFPAATINPGEYLLVSVNAQAMYNTFGVTAYQWTNGALNNGGEDVQLMDKFGNLVDMVDYSPELPWDTLADGYGPSLTFCNPDLDNNIAENWTISTEFAAVNTANDTIWATPGTGCAILPFAEFTADNTSIQEGQSVNFTDLSTGNPTNWEWTFQGGTPSTFNGQIPPAVVYNTAGTYDVSLTVTNAYGQSTETKEDFIEVFELPPPPAANFAANLTTIYVGESIDFTDLSTNVPTSWQWTFEGGTPSSSTVQNPTGITYNTAGSFDVTLTATNAYGSDTEVKADYITVQVIPPPQAAFTASETTIFVGESITFTDQSAGNPTSWDWTFEGGTPSG
ncbi:MAG: lamin tail domain-containing protein [Bacteroidales bacterium]